MQLIVEAETTLDIERNMSSVEDVHNNKKEMLVIEDINKTCNGNKDIIEVNTRLGNEESNEEKMEIEGAVAKISMNIDNNEAELSNVDLSEIISKQNSLNTDDDDAQVEESQNSKIEKETNDLQTEHEIKADDVEQDDYLEDDIISFSDEHFNGIKEESKESEPTVVDNCVSTIEEKTIEEDKDEIIVETAESPAEVEALTHATPQKDKQVLDVIQEILDSPIPSENKEDIPIIEVEKEQLDISAESTISDSHKNKIISEADVDKDEIMLIEDDNIDLTEKDKVDLIEEENDCIIEENKENISEEDKHVEHNKSKLKGCDQIELDNDITEVDLTEIPKQTLAEASSPLKEKSRDETPVSSDPKKSVETDQLNSILKDDDEVKLVDETETVSVQSNNKADAIKGSETADNSKTNHDVDSDINSSSKVSNSSDCKSTVDTVNIEAVDSPIVLKDDVMDVDEPAEETKTQAVDSPIELKDDMDVEEVVEERKKKEEVSSPTKETACVNNTINKPVKEVPVTKVIDNPVICKLSNTLDILSDDDEEEPSKASEVPPKVDPPKADDAILDSTKAKPCIDIEDDDDIMLIDEDSNKTATNVTVDTISKEIPTAKSDVNIDSETGEKTVQEATNIEGASDENKETAPPASPTTNSTIENDNKETPLENETEKPEPPAPLIPENFVKTAKKKLSDMTREDLEEFCILKIVESIVDRSSLSDIKIKLRTMSQGLEEYRKKAMMLTKQNRDLQVVLKSVQEEQKKSMGDTPITPLKITRSVGMQVFMEKTLIKKKPQNAFNKNPNTPQNKAQQGNRAKPPSLPIPVPRLVPAHNPGLKTPNTVPQVNQVNATSKNNVPNGIKPSPPTAKVEKRPHSKIASSVTVDLTDDEPPAKIAGGPKTSPAPPVRLVPPQNLMAPRQAFSAGVNSPRKVYIPISGPQNQQLRPGQTIMLKTVVPPGIRPRYPTPQVTKVEPNAVRMNRVAARHPAPLPLAMKQYQPPNWKSLPPAPDLKLSKVENGIVISWKIEGIPEDSYEEIASYQLYAYQETSSPPSTTLWKKIGDVKALPLPMACTLTQFMAGFKYYFAVRAVDIRSRLGPFSLPGSILLLSKSI